MSNINRPNRGWKVLLLIFIVIFFRVCLVSLPSYKIDMNTWQAWTGRLLEVTPLNFYSPTYFADYFPGYLYILWFLGSSFHLIFDLPITSINFEHYLKLFTNLFDVLTALIIYKIVSRYNRKWNLVAALIYLANPALLFNSSIMGQVDGILTFFLLYSIYYLLELKKPLGWSITSAMAFLVKPQGLAIFPISFIYLLKNFPYQKIFLVFLIPVLMIFLSIPFFLKEPIFGLFYLLQKSASTYPYTSLFSYNFWSFAGYWVFDSTTFANITYQVWGLIIFCIFLIIITLPLFRKNISNITYYFAFALSSMAFFLFLTRMHQRYLFPFFAFFLIVVLAKGSIKMLVIYLLLSLIHFANLWHVYYYYNYVHPNPLFSPGIIFNFLQTNYNLFSILNLLGWGYLVKLYYDKKNS